VFIHETECPRYDAADRIPQQLRRRLLALRGYDFEQRLLGGDVVDGKGIEGTLDDLLAKPEVAFVHVRFARAGCFACLVERDRPFATAGEDVRPTVPAASAESTAIEVARRWCGVIMRQRVSLRR
jgi:hypothetical protein